MDCLSCRSSDLRYLNNNGRCQCNDGYYHDVSTNTCKPCSFSCQKCIGPNLNDCLSCIPNTFRSLSADSKCECNNYYYESGV